MAKIKSSVKKVGVKPLTSRPLDLSYFLFFFIHFACTLLIDLLPIWPLALQQLPIAKQLHAVFTAVVDDYLKKSNDPFILTTRGIGIRHWEFGWLSTFMWLELPIQLPGCLIGMIGLQKDSPKVYPLMLAYSAAAIVSTTTVFIMVLTAPSDSDPALDNTLQFYALTEENRQVILGPLIPFLIVPVVMFVDMMIRLAGLVNAGMKSLQMKA